MKEVSVEEAWEKKYPEQIVLVTTISDEGRPNIIVLGWSMCTSFQPPMLAISVGKTRYSHKLLFEVPEFGLLFPSSEQKEDMLYCGTHSGRDVDKFKEIGLKPFKSKFIKPPLIEEVVAAFECKVKGTLETGDHTIFAGEILAAYISEEQKRRIYSLGGERFGKL